MGAPSSFMESSLETLSNLRHLFYGKSKTLLVGLPFLHHIMCDILRHIMCNILRLYSFLLPCWQQNLLLFERIHQFLLWLPCTRDLIWF